jgi:ATP-binding cassette, subfamily C (CFTR/MRP), member 1
LCDSATIIVTGHRYLHLAWSAPLQVIACIVLLYRLLGAASLVGVLVMLAASAVANYQCRLVADFIEEKTAVSDSRLRVLSEFLTMMREVKMHAWEKLVKGKVGALRDEQLGWAWRVNFAEALGWALWDALPTVVTVTTLAVASRSIRLTPQVVFPALAILDIIRFPLTVGPEVLQGIVGASVSLGRITSFLLSDEAPGRLQDSDPKDARNRAAVFSGGECYWKIDSPVIREASFEIPKEKLTIVTGESGSGKTALISALLGEMSWSPPASLEGSFSPRINGASIAFAPETPFIFNDTVKSNILFGCDRHDDAWYHSVVDACGLREDLNMMPAADATEVGSRGLTLSGGQRARIAMARCVYAEADVYIFDATLSSLDAQLSTHVFQNVFCGLLAGKTVLLVTHDLDLCQYGDFLVAVEDGRVRSARENPKKKTMHLPRTTPRPSVITQGLGGSSRTTTDEMAGRSHEILREASDIRWYTSFSGVALPVLALAIVALSQVATLSVDGFLSQWTSSSSLQSTASAQATTWHHVYLLILISSVACTLQLGKQLVGAIAGLRVSKDVHEACLSAVTRAPMSFFDETPVGRILNRFGGDMEQLDFSLPLHLVSAATYTCSCLFMVALVFFITPLAAVVIIPLTITYFIIGVNFARVKRQLQHLKSVSQSPLHSSFSETLEGIKVIRAFSRGDVSTVEFRKAMDDNTNALAALTFANRYMDGRAATLGAMSIASAAGAAIFSRGFLSPSLAGLSLLWAFKVAAPLRWLPSMAATVETGLVSAERLRWVTEIAPEAAAETDVDATLEKWPTIGEISLDSICVRYRPQFPFALHELSMFIKGGSRIGICGRSGTGKSSLLASLLRIVELESGSISIDGVDLRNVGLRKLRSKIGVVSQSPALFRGTVRENVDPEGLSRDAEIWLALERAEMRARVVAMGGLDAMVSDSGSNVSAGERQLLALARALRTARETRVIVLDEPSSNVDWRSDALIQKAICEDFRDATVLIVAHRLRTICDCDAVVVLDSGRVVEGPERPAALLRRPNSRFARLAAEMGVDAVGELMALAVAAEVK